MEDSYETGKADLKGTDGRSGSMGDPGAGDSDDRIPAQAGSGVWTFGGTGSSCVDIALDMDATHAGRHIQASAMKRFLVMAVVLALAMTQYRYIHPVGTVLGMFGMKISAFMQPKIHRLMASHKGSSVKS